MTDKEFREDVGGQATADTVDLADVPDGAPSHRVEYAVRRHLLSHPQLRFSSLVVRRIDDGVCLEGVVETDSAATDVERLAAAIEGVNQVLNRLVVRCSCEAPAPKG